VSAERKSHAYLDQTRRELSQYAHGLLRENERLRASLAIVESEQRRLERELKQRDEAVNELDRLRGRLAEIEQENAQYAAQYQQIEQQSSNLSNLYVASYQLHTSMDRQEILRTIQEIVINLIGSEEIAIFEGDESGNFTLASSIGVDGSRLRSFTLGEGTIGRRLKSGEVFAEDFPNRDGRLTACVPLKIGDRITGAILVFRLLAHKTSLEPLDHELFELLAVHAATALYSANLHQKSLAGTVPA